jgi:hypothetical protein
MDADDNIDRRWLIILACACPNCGNPSITYLLPDFEPSETFIDQIVMHAVTCDRCQRKYVPPALGCHRHVVPWNLQKYYPPCT